MEYQRIFETFGVIFFLVKTFYFLNKWSQIIATEIPFPLKSVSVIPSGDLLTHAEQSFYGFCPFVSCRGN